MSLSVDPSLFPEIYPRARAKVPVKIRLRGGMIRRRPPHVVVLLILGTVGIWGVYWLWATTRELARATEDPTVHANREVVYVVGTLGLWAIRVLYRNAQKIHGSSMYFRRSHKDQASRVLLLALGGLFSFGLLGLLAVQAVQEQLNEMADLADERERARAERDSERTLTSYPSSPGLAAVILGSRRVARS